MWKIIRIFLRLFFIKEYQVRNTFFVIEVCWQNIFLNHFIHKMMPYFNSSPLIKNSKFHNSIISFGYVDSSAKIFLILYPPLENSTTCIAITSTHGVTLFFTKHFSRLICNEFIRWFYQSREKSPSFWFTHDRMYLISIFIRPATVQAIFGEPRSIWRPPI